MSVTEPMMIDCGRHGERVSAVICQHLLKRDPFPSGFVENSDDPHNLQAWCHLCEEKFQFEGEMTDAFKQFNDMAIVCVVCYDELKAHHTILVAQ